MKKFLLWLAKVLAIVSFTVVAVMAFKKWRDKAIQDTADEEIKQGIQYGQDRFLERVEEKIQEISTAKAEEITKRWNERFKVGG